MSIGFEYFDTERLYKEVESKSKGDIANIIMSYKETGFSHRWIHPPVVCYFVSSLDEYGNTDMAPISMGTAMWGNLLRVNGSLFSMSRIPGRPRKTFPRIRNVSSATILLN